VSERIGPIGRRASGSAPPPEREQDGSRRPRSRWSSFARIGFEFALLFAIALAAKQALVGLAPGTYPNPLWLPVIMLSMQHGMAVGLGAAVAAAGVHYWEGLPPELLSEDLYSYIGRVAAEPVGWCCVALLIGHIRSRQLQNVAELETNLAERTRQCTAVEDLCVDLRGRTELLERHIAANAFASNSDIVEAMAALNQATAEDFPECLTRFVNLMTGAADFSVYLRRDEVLEVAFQPEDKHRLGRAEAVPSDDPVFAAVINQRRLLSATQPADAVLLANRWILAGPLLSSGSHRAPAGEHSAAEPESVIGMFAIAGAALEDHPEDVARRFSLTGAEISRLFGRIALIERWNAAQLPRPANGRELPRPLPRDSQSDHPAAPTATGGDGRQDHQATAR
jgi:hypothetical protein